MTTEQVKAIVALCLEEFGVYYDGKDDFILKQSLRNSLNFVSFFVELETRLEIELPLGLLGAEKMGSFNGFCEALTEFINRPNNT